MYYLKDSASNVTRLPDVVPTDFVPSRMAFMKYKKGYYAYVTSKNTDSVLVIRLKNPILRNR